jgi:hypothetical protein
MGLYMLCGRSSVNLVLLGNMYQSTQSNRTSKFDTIFYMRFSQFYIDYLGLILVLKQYIHIYYISVLLFIFS